MFSESNVFEWMERNFVTIRIEQQILNLKIFFNNQLLIFYLNKTARVHQLCHYMMTQTNCIRFNWPNWASVESCRRAVWSPWRQGVWLLRDRYLASARCAHHGDREHVTVERPLSRQREVWSPWRQGVRDCWETARGSFSSGREYQLTWVSGKLWKYPGSVLLYML